jgi:uncharacterized membrane protein
MASFFSKLDSDRIVKAIADAERRSTAQIRVHVTHHVPKHLERRAERRFGLLGMTHTRERNGVLIYVAPKARKFRILGDVAIHEKCGDDFWKDVASAMEGYFRKGQFTEGIVHGVDRVGEVLEEHFPRKGNEPAQNELPDEIDED